MKFADLPEHPVRGGLLPQGIEVCAGNRPPPFKSPEDAEPWLTEQMSKTGRLSQGYIVEGTPIDVSGKLHQ